MPGRSKRHAACSIANINPSLRRSNMIRHFRFVVPTFLACAVTVAAWVASGRPAEAAPVEYVKICDYYGAGYFY
ncbi:MAG: porin, partial [Xanthobacteraceae bacterium]